MYIFYKHVMFTGEIKKIQIRGTHNMLDYLLDFGVTSGLNPASPGILITKRIYIHFISIQKHMHLRVLMN